MRIRHILYRSPLPVFFLFLILSHTGTAAQISESGLYPLYNFSPKEYDALEQNFCAIQDLRGMMYFGNNQGVLEYDGVNWNLIRTTEESPVRSMAIDRSGRIFVGARNEFGYLAVDSVGQLNYKALSNKLEDKNLDFNIIWETHATESSVLFQAYHYIFEWKDDSLFTLHSDKEIHESFFVEGNLFLNFSEEGLAILNDNQLVGLPGGNVFKDILIYGMIRFKPGVLLIATESNGFYSLELNSQDLEKTRIHKIQTANDQLFSSLEVFNLERISPNRISIGTWGNGSIIIDTLFNVVTILDKNNGLQNDIVMGQYADPAGYLWLTLANGISRVETNTPLTMFTDRKGLTGTVQSITRFNNTIYVATNTGLFYLEQVPFNSKLTKYSQAVFTLIDGLDFECWDMINFRRGREEILLIITNDAVIEVDKEHNYEYLLEDYAWKLYQSKLDTNRLFIGLESGLTSFYREDNKWINEGAIREISEEIKSISEDHIGNLWLGTEEEGVIRIYIKDFVEDRIGGYHINHYDTTDGLPIGPYIITQFKGPPTIATRNGLFKFKMHEKRFEPDSTYGIQFADGTYFIHRITEYTRPDIWMVTIEETSRYKYEYGVGYLKPTGDKKYRWVNEPFKQLSEELTHAIFQDGEKITWFGGSAGVFRYDPEIKKDYRRDFNAYVREVRQSEGSILFNGSFTDLNDIAGMVQPGFMKPVLPYTGNSLVFNYASQPGDDESFMRFSYFLEGNDLNWSEWTDETYRVYTNLREGKYTFRVKAQNGYGHISNEATYEFTILSPWFRKWWAYFLYVLLASAAVYTIVKVYTRQLREIIRERTVEVVAQKEVIEEKNKDIMDSIQYAKKIQRALLPPEDDLGKLNLDGFILFLPRDVVSGDFYWLAKQDGKIITVAADCTGHGVPGAFMSMLGVAFLNNIIGAQGIVRAADILNELRTDVIEALKQKGQEGEQKDGMDVALHVIDYDKMKIEFAGANNPLIIIRDNEIMQIKPDRMPIGIHERADEPFKNHELKTKKGDVLYTYSDGFQDQFGGPSNKKFMPKNLKNLFLQIHRKPMDQQKLILEKTFYDWTIPYNTEQIDDVIIIGVRI